jgi:hypothetical protein
LPLPEPQQGVDIPFGAVGRCMRDAKRVGRIDRPQEPPHLLPRVGAKARAVIVPGPRHPDEGAHVMVDAVLRRFLVPYLNVSAEK